VYSGPIAGTAYARLRPWKGRFRRVVLLGPAHRVPLRGLALPQAEVFASPLGPVRVDEAAAAVLLALPQVQVNSMAHSLEHSLEVHLPFLQEVLEEGFTIVPLVVGEASPAEVAQALELLWDETETLVVVSSDLSHYHDYATARKLDQETSRAIEALQVEALRPDQACGCIPIQGLLQAARQRALRVVKVDLRNSGDTAGSRDQVVGYGAYVVC
jgi:AmmeMemoRadiSam system protein B